MALTLSTQTDLYRFFAIAFNAAPGVTYMNQLYAASESGMSVKDIVNAFTTKTEFTSTYPAFLTNATFAANLIDNVVGTSATAAAKTAAKEQVEAALTSGLSRGDVVYNIFNNLAALTGDATWGGTATLLANKVAYAKYYTETLLGGAEATPSLAALKAVVSSVTTASSAVAADIAAVLNPAPAPANQTFELTAGVDTGAAYTGGAGNDTFVGTNSTLTIFDSLNGGTGTDSLNLTFGADVTEIAAGAVTASIENIAVQAAGAVTADISDWTGVNTVMIQGAGADDDVTVVSAAYASVPVSANGDISITDATALAITAVATGDDNDVVTVDADLATSVTLIDVNSNSSVTAPKLATLNLTDIATTSDVTVTLEDLTSTALTVNLSVGGDNDVVLVDNDDKVTGLTITVSSDVEANIVFTGATALTLNGAGAVTLNDNDGTSDVGLDAVKTISVSGAVDLTIDTTSMGAVKGLTSTSTGDLDVTIDNDVAISTGAGDDIVTLTVNLAATDTISLGAGNDRLEIVSKSIAAVAAGAINGGEGALDVIAADNDNLGTDFSADIQGFEVLAVTDQLVNGQTVDVDKFDGVQRVVLESGYDNDVTIDNLDSGAFVTLGAANNVAPDNDDLIIVLDNDDGVADAITITVESSGANDYDYGTMVVTGIESVTLNAVATGTTTDNDVKIGFDNDTDLTNLTINASTEGKGAVNKVTIDGALVAVDTVNASGAGKTDITIDFTGNSGVDYTGSAGTDTVTLGELGSFTGGGDNDVFVVTTVANGNRYSTIEDLTAGDKIDFMSNDTNDNDMDFNEDMIELADTAAFADYLAAASSVSAGENDLELSWFQFQGNTFLIVDNSATDAFVNGTDQIVKITGLVDLSDSTITTDGTNVLTIV